MGLSERKVKQKIGLDPRNLSWSDDKSRFAYKQLKSLGWSDNQGLGSSQDGNPNHIAVARKLDNSGIGVGRARKEGDELGGQAGAGLNDVLKRLAAAASASPSPSPASEVREGEGKEEGEKELKRRNKIASRQRHLTSKRMASQDPAALAAILGISVSELPTPSISGTSTPTSPAPSASASTSTPAPSTPGQPERDAENMVSTSTLSVSDYFRQKLRAKALARQAASGSSTPLPAELSAQLPVSPPKPASDWEGSRTTFDQAAVQLETLGGYELTAPDEPPVMAATPGLGSRGQTEHGGSGSGASGASTPAEAEETAEQKAARRAAKKARRAEKEAKKARKEAKRGEGESGDGVAASSSILTAPISSGVDEEGGDTPAIDDKAARKAARRAEKDKKRKRE